MAAAPSKLAQLNSRLARAFGTATGALGVMVGENAGYVAQCAEATYLTACKKAADAGTAIRIALSR